jgi:hypothetical protein
LLMSGGRGGSDAEQPVEVKVEQDGHFLIFSRTSMAPKDEKQSKAMVADFRLLSEYLSPGDADFAFSALDSFALKPGFIPKRVCLGRSIWPFGGWWQPLIVSIFAVLYLIFSRTYVRRGFGFLTGDE